MELSEIMDIIRNGRIDLLDDNGDYAVSYLDDEKEYDEVYRFYKSKIKELVEDGDGVSFKKAKFLFPQMFEFNIINLDDRAIDIKGFYWIKSYSLVRDKKKIIEKYLGGEFLRIKQKLWREFTKNKKSLESEKEIENFRKETEEIANMYDRLLQDIKNNSDKYELIYTTLPFLTQPYRPYVKFKIEGEDKIFKKNIRKGIINVIYKSKFNLNRNKEFISKVLKGMDGNVGKIFYKRI